MVTQEEDFILGLPRCFDLVAIGYCCCCYYYCLLVVAVIIAVILLLNLKEDC